MIVLFFVITAIICIFTGFMIATIQASKSIDKLRAELDIAISKDRIRYALHESVMPHTLSHSVAWNAALLDVAKRLGIDDAD